MESILNLDLLWVGIAVAGAGTLGCSIYFSEPKSATARAYLFFTIASICWSVANFASIRAGTGFSIIWFIRIVLFFAIWHAFSFLLLAYQFPSRKAVMPHLLFIILLVWTSGISLLTLTPFIYQSITQVLPTVETKTGPGIALFGITVIIYVSIGLWKLVRTFFKSMGLDRKRMEPVLAGVILTFVFLITFDFIFPAFLNIPTLVSLGGLFLLPFIVGTAYSILHYRLFNIQVAVFGLLTFFLATATFFDILFSNNLLLILYRVGELALVLLSGVWLLRTMVREVEQREKIEKLAEELEQTNERQEGLIHFISHEVKGFLARYMGAFSGFVDGDYGVLPEPAKQLVTQLLPQSRKDSRMVMDLLQASNLKKGLVSFQMAPFDCRVVVSEIVEKLKPSAEAKGLALHFPSAESTESFMLVGDKEKLEDHVFQNLIENSINYTPSGSIAVSLTKTVDKIIFSVTDTGIGITSEDKARLFTEGGQGKESSKINVHSTGYGLYIAKSTVEAHHGTIRAESEGAGKGSSFIAEIPLMQPAV
ncbi:hypothetical protein H0X32_01590 [Patescibacteria group bacterium]|nr:hypothetical protein [Patescibacteria group bacterium]